MRGDGKPPPWKGNEVRFCTDKTNMGDKGATQLTLLGDIDVLQFTPRVSGMHVV